MRANSRERGGRLQPHDLLKMQLLVLLDLRHEVRSRPFRPLECVRVPGSTAADAAQPVLADLCYSLPHADDPLHPAVLPRLCPSGCIPQSIQYAAEVAMALLLQQICEAGRQLLLLLLLLLFVPSDRNSTRAGTRMHQPSSEDRPCTSIQDVEAARHGLLLALWMLLG